MLKLKVTKNTISKNVQRIRQRFPGVTARAIYDELREVELPETQRLVPLDTGDLQSTGRVTEPVVRNATASASIAYGGPSASGKDVDYALVVHEDLEALHKNGREAKYITKPLNQAAPYMAERLARRMRFENWVNRA